MVADLLWQRWSSWPASWCSLIEDSLVFNAHLTIRSSLALPHNVCLFGSLLFSSPCCRLSLPFWVHPSLRESSIGRLGVLIRACKPLGTAKYCKRAFLMTSTLFCLSWVCAQSYINMLLQREGEERTDIRPQMTSKSSHANPIENELQKQKTR